MHFSNVANKCKWITLAQVLKYNILNKLITVRMLKLKRVKLKKCKFVKNVVNNKLKGKFIVGNKTGWTYN